jgi:osmotically inducible protein OsmC
MNATGYSAWTGPWKTGAGTLSTHGDTLKQAPYSYASRFEDAPGASPEELLAAAHAGCFNQALANNFGMVEFVAESISTSVSIELGTGADGHPAIKGVHVVTKARVPGITQERFHYCAERARTNCTLAKLFKLDVTMQATLLDA